MSGETHKVRAHQRIITPECRNNRGELGALNEALGTVGKSVLDLYRHWPIEKGAKIILTVEVEYADDFGSP